MGDTAEDVYKDVTSTVFEHVMPHTPPVASSPSDIDVSRLRADLQASQQEVAKLRSDLQASQDQSSKLQAEVQSAKGDVELATLKENELQSRLEKALASRSEEQMQLRQAQQDLETAQNELQHQRDLSMEMSSSDHQVLEQVNTELRAKVSVLESELSVLYSQRQASTTLPPDGEPSGAFPNASASSDDASLLGAAYQQISVLNTQLAHLYTELTLARNEVATLRGEKGDGEDGPGAARPVVTEETMAMESQKQAQQIADLVSDIRHLQLDLEYHQQKVDQLLEEKQLMMKDFKAAQNEIAEVKKELEEKDQLIKHQEVDLLHYRQQEQQNSAGLHGASSDDGILEALRSEAAAKDSALIVSHYELHKEKLMRDRLEQKNLKLMERMQKLMMVVETMRKDNQTLERALASKDRSYEDKDVQLRIMTQKFRQLHKNSKQANGRSKSSKARPAMLELESSMQNLPPLDSSRRSESVNGRMSTTPRNAPQSPYHSAR